MSRTIELRLLVLLICIAAAAATVAEPLEYSVAYRGVFSMGRDMPIADVSLRVSEPDSGREFREFTLEASSAAYPVVESLYPLRYRYRTWANARDGNVLAFETYEKTGKLRHRLYLRDITGPGFSRHDPNGDEGAQAVERLKAGELPRRISVDALDESTLSDLVLDRLGLLHYVRDKTLREGAEFLLPVSNGRDRLRYRVRVEAAQSLLLHDLRLPAWKLRFDGFEIAADGTERPAHRALFVWLSRDPDHLPLRVDSRHAIGLFRVELKDPAIHAQLAQSHALQSSTRRR